MRLRILDHGHGRRQRLALTFIRWVNRSEPDPVLKLSLYRPELFGRYFLGLGEAVMRGQSEWTPGERELMAGFVSQLNTCPFCAGIHVEIAGSRNSGIVDPREQWRQGTLSPQISATFALLEKVTLDPDAVGPEDIVRVRQAGVSDSAIVDALYVSFLFNCINRIANAFDFGWDSDADRLKLAKGLDRSGYHVPEFLFH